MPSFTVATSVASMAREIAERARAQTSQPQRGRAKRQPRTAKPRVCVAQECETILSRYNSQTICWQHEKAMLDIQSPRGAARLMPERWGTAGN
jgi:hypothetical protein